MIDIIVKTKLFSLRNLIAYRLIGNTITEKIGEQVLDADFIVSLVKHNHNVHCISCLTYDIFSTAMLIYALSYHTSREPTTIKKLEKVEKLHNLRKLTSSTLWIILFVLTKYVENAS